ncbi:hypothetical protein QTN25_004857 [Entamoeba marina]
MKKTKKGRNDDVKKLIDKFFIDSFNNCYYITVQSFNCFCIENEIFDYIGKLESELNSRSYVFSYPVTKVASQPNSSTKYMNQVMSDSIKSIPFDFIFAHEEIGFQFEFGERIRVVKPPSNQSNTFSFKRNTKLSNTVVSICADGSIGQPLAILKEKHLRDIKQNSSIEVSDIQSDQLLYTNGMFYTGELYQKWFQNVFINEIKHKKKMKKYNGNVVLFIHEYFKSYIDKLQSECENVNLVILYFNDEDMNNFKPFENMSNDLNQFVNKMLGEKSRNKVIVSVRAEIRSILEFFASNPALIKSSFSFLKDKKGKLRHKSITTIVEHDTETENNEDLTSEEQSKPIRMKKRKHTNKKQIKEESSEKSIMDSVKENNLIDIEKTIQSYLDSHVVVTKNTIVDLLDENGLDTIHYKKILRQMNLEFATFIPEEPRNPTRKEVIKYQKALQSKLTGLHKSLVYNLDEFDFRFRSIEPVKAIVPTNNTNHYYMSRESKKSSIIFCVVADGKALQPLCVMPEQFDKKSKFSAVEYAQQIEKENVYSRTELWEWFDDKKRQKITSRALLICDEYFEELLPLKKIKKSGVDVIFIPRYVTPYIQPLEELFDDLLTNILIDTPSFVRKCFKSCGIAANKSSVSRCDYSGEEMWEYVKRKIHEYDSPLEIVIEEHSDVDDEGDEPKEVFELRSKRKVLRKGMKQILESEEFSMNERYSEQFEFLCANYPLYVSLLDDTSKSAKLQKRQLSDEIDDDIE